MSYQETIDYLYGLQKHGIKLGLANSFRLMELMGDPPARFRSVHIAGTNGKGSTAAFTAAMLEASGFRVGLYTSPHLVSFTERIQVNRRQIAEQKVVELADRIRAGCCRLPSPDGSGPMNPTFFEVTTAIAFAYFAEQGVDYAVVETGMGGRLDATNVVTPLVSVITTIDLDHQEFLGTSLEAIAAEKAGIIKPGVPVVTGALRPGARSVIGRRAEELRAPLYPMPEAFGPCAEQVGSQTFDYRGISSSFAGLRIALPGRHQFKNAALALAAVECLRASGVAVSDEAVRTGLAAARWEGRLERMAERPDIYLDGAHNPAAAQALAEVIGEWKDRYRAVHLVLGILGDKDYRGILALLLPLADRVIVTRPDYGRALSTGALAAEIRGMHSAVETAPSVAEAVAAARAAAGPDDLILITGSLYTVGDARAALRRDQGAPNALPGLRG